MLRQILSILILLSCISSPALTAPVSSADLFLSDSIKSLRDDMKALDKAAQEHDKDIIKLNEGLAHQTLRIEQLNSSLDRGYVLLGIGFATLTIILAVAGVLTYKNARSDAAATAKKSAEEWLDLNGQSIIERLKKLEEVAETRVEYITAKCAQSDELTESIPLAQNTTPEENEKPPELQNKPESDYTADDWHIRARNAYNNADHDDALRAWSMVISHKDASESLKSKAMFNIGYTLSELNKKEEAIKQYNEMIKIFSTTTDKHILEGVVSAMFNLGFIHSRQEKFEKAIFTFKRLIERFGESTDLPIQKVAALAMNELAINYAHLEKLPRAIETYKNLISRFRDVPEFDLQEQVAKAMYNLGVTYGNQGSTDKEISTYQELISRFGAASELALQEQVAKAMYNLAMTYGQAGKTPDAKHILKELISKFPNSLSPIIQECVTDAQKSLARIRE